MMWLSLILLGCPNADVACDATCPSGTNLVTMDFESTIRDGTMVVEGDRCLAFCEPAAPCSFPNVPVADEDSFRCVPLEGYTTVSSSSDVDTRFGDAWHPLESAVSTPFGDWPLDADAGDMDGDGIDDLVIIGNSGGTQLLFGLGDGRFEPSPMTLFDTVAPQTVALLDMDNDGLLDVVVGARASDTVDLWLHRGDGAGGVGLGELLTTGAGGGLLAADIDGDGQKDLFSSAPPYAAHFVDNAALTTVEVPGGPWGSQQVQHTLADLQGDGRLDVLVSASGGSYFSNAGGRSFDSPIIDISGRDDWSMCFGHDGDGDGRDEALVWNSDLQQLDRYDLHDVVTLLNPIADAPYDFVGRTGDVTGDGIPDLLSMSLGFLASNDGLPYYAARPGPIPVITLPADLDGDGISELIILDGTAIVGVWP